MALEGTIRDFGLADIFQLIGIQRKTGTLTLSHDRETVVVKFHEGSVVAAETVNRNLEDLLGSVLVRTGRITEAQLQEALRIQGKTLQRMGWILVDRNFLSEADLREALHVQVTQIVYRLFRWRDGRYQFVPSDHVDFDRERFVPVPAETILMEGARMIDEWPMLERKIRSADLVFRHTEAGKRLAAPVRSLVEEDVDYSLVGGDDETVGGDGPDRLRLTPEESQVLRLVDGTNRIQDIVDRNNLGEFDTYRILVELLHRNLVEEAAPSAAAGAPSSGSGLLRHLGVAIVAAAALLGALTLRYNPLAPWNLSSTAGETERLKTYASRSRLGRVEKGLEVFYLATGSLPEGLEDLARYGYLSPRDLVDPWGRPYAYRPGPAGWDLQGADREGRPEESLRLQKVFGATRRMILEGAAR